MFYAIGFDKKCYEYSDGYKKNRMISNSIIKNTTLYSKDCYVNFSEKLTYNDNTKLY